MAVGTVAEAGEDSAVIRHVFTATLIEVTRQTEIRARGAMGKRKGVGPFIWRPMTGRTVLAHIVATADGFRIVGHKSCGWPLVGISPPPDCGGTGVTVFAHSRFRQMSEGETRECGEGMATDTVLAGNMRCGRTIFFMTADAGSWRRRVIEAAHDGIEFGKAVAAYAILLGHVRRDRTVLFMTAVARRRLRIMERCVQVAFE